MKLILDIRLERKVIASDNKALGPLMNTFTQLLKMFQLCQREFRGMTPDQAKISIFTSRKAGRTTSQAAALLIRQNFTNQINLLQPPLSRGALQKPRALTLSAKPWKEELPFNRNKPRAGPVSYRGPLLLRAGLVKEEEQGI